MLIALHGGIDQFGKSSESVLYNMIVCVYTVEMFLA